MIGNVLRFPLKHLILSIQTLLQKARNTTQALTAVAVLTPSPFVPHRCPLHLSMLDVSVVLQRC